MSLSLIFILTQIAVAFVLLCYFANRRHIAISAPITMACLVVMYLTIKTIQSQPILGLPDRFQVISFSLVGDTVYVWAYTDSRDYPSTYLLPYNENSVAKLQSLSDATKEGEGKLGILTDTADGQEIAIEDGTLDSPESIRSLSK